MGLKDSVKKAVPVVFVKETEKPKTLTTEQVVEVYVDTAISIIKEAKPVLRFVPSKGCRQTENANWACDSCDKKDILSEVGKLLLCDDCAKRELEAIRNAVPEEKFTPSLHPAVAASIEALNVNEHYEKTLAQDNTPLYAKGREASYYEFFNRSYDIDKMTDEQLRDSIIEDGNTLFEVKVKQQKKIISLKERLAKKTEKEREKFRLDDLEYKPNLEEESILPKPKKSAKEKAVDSLKNLGLDASDLASLLKRFEKK